MMVTLLAALAFARNKKNHAIIEDKGCHEGNCGEGYYIPRRRRCDDYKDDCDNHETDKLSHEYLHGSEGYGGAVGGSGSGSGGYGSGGYGGAVGGSSGCGSSCGTLRNITSTIKANSSSSLSGDNSTNSQTSQAFFDLNLSRITIGLTLGVLLPIFGMML